jgi:hypothetical protein
MIRKNIPYLFVIVFSWGTFTHTVAYHLAGMAQSLQIIKHTGYLSGLSLASVVTAISLYTITHPPICPSPNLAACLRWEFKQRFKNKDYASAYEFFIANRTTMGVWSQQEAKEFQTMARIAVDQIVNDMQSLRWFSAPTQNDMWYITILMQLVEDPTAYPKALLADLLIDISAKNKEKVALKSRHYAWVDWSPDNKQELCAALQTWEQDARPDEQKHIAKLRKNRFACS